MKIVWFGLTCRLLKLNKANTTLFFSTAIGRNTSFYESPYFTYVTGRIVLQGEKACCAFRTERHASLQTFFVK
jgi:hypothetical protein